MLHPPQAAEILIFSLIYLGWDEAIAKPNRVHLYFARAKHFGRQFISDNQRFTAEMLRPYEYICYIFLIFN